ncbi:MAG: hypothetical protein K2H34_03375 [Lachnospiraceae bacterium]|nr:hypothetical protein [Lachnospiraceae bacterium]
MSNNTICRMEHVTVNGQQNIGLEDISLKIAENHLVALISEDDSAGEVLKVMAGLREIQSGKADYSGLEKVWAKGNAHREIVGRQKNIRSKKENIQSGKIAYSRLKAVTGAGKSADIEEKEKASMFMRPVQYVPDDIVCYDGLTVAAFLQGMAGDNEGILNEADRLVNIFNIDKRELLLNMTFEQNRLVSVIQAMMAKPSLLLLNRPYDMLTEKTHKLLLKEIVALYAQGSTVILAAEHFEDVVLPAHDYIFLKEGKILGSFTKNQLPVPAKVITMWGGSVSSMLSEKMTMLIRRKGYCRFLYRETNMKELALRLSMTGCKNFNIEELTMEEMLFEDYERWLS